MSPRVDNEPEIAPVEPAPQAEPSLADELIDELVPGDFDWRQLARSYPKLALALAATGGFLLGRSQGRVLVAAIAKFGADAVNQSINEFFGQEIV